MNDRLRREYAEQLKQDYLQSGFKQGFEAGYAKAKEDFERPHGEWTSNGNDLEAICSVCGEALPCSDEYDYETNFCPNCGAKMEEGEK